MATGLLVGLSATSALAPEAAAVDWRPGEGRRHRLQRLQPRLRHIRARSTIAWIFDQIRVGDRVYVYWS
jgi:hypothetical protein